MEQLRDYRLSKSMTLHEMADELGISYVSLWEYENSKKTPRPKTANMISEKTGISREYLIFGDVK